MSEQHPSQPSEEVALHSPELGLYEGLPPVSEYGYYPVGDIPYVHDARISVSAGPVAQEDLGQQRVITAHGYNTGGEWTLADGRPVVEVIAAYNTTHPEKPITIAAICNPSDTITKRSSDFSHAAGSDVGVSGFFDQDGIVMHLSLKDADNGAWHVAQVGEVPSKTIIG